MTGLEIAVGAIAAGTIATVSLDLWQVGLARICGIPATNWNLVGRWFGHIPGGVFVHENISRSPALAREGAIGWLAQYAISMIYASGYLLLVHVFLRGKAGIASAAAFGLGTVLLPWITLHPGMGLGFFATKAPDPVRVRALSVLSHLIFGLGLFLGTEFLETFRAPLGFASEN